jgi:hypothetical protein
MKNLKNSRYNYKQTILLIFIFNYINIHNTTEDYMHLNLNSYFNLPIFSITNGNNLGNIIFKQDLVQITHIQSVFRSLAGTWAQRSAACALFTVGCGVVWKLMDHRTECAGNVLTQNIERDTAVNAKKIAGALVVIGAVATGAMLLNCVGALRADQICRFYHDLKSNHIMPM